MQACKGFGVVITPRDGVYTPVFSFPGSFANMAVAVAVNKGRPINRLYHFMSSGHVLVRSCVSVFAVTTPLVFSCVDIAQRISHATNVLFPIPCPDATASLTTLSLIFTPSLMSFSMSFCHSSDRSFFPAAPVLPTEKQSRQILRGRACSRPRLRQVQ